MKKMKPQNSKRKIRFVSYDDPRVKKQLDKLVYQDYLRNIYTNNEGGGTNE